MGRKGAQRQAVRDSRAIGELGRPRLRIGTTETKGRGLFAASDIPAGTVVARYLGRPRWIWDIPKRLWEHCFQVGYDQYLAPSKGSHGWFINHSCNPNSGIAGERTIVALRDISSGEELTFDYSTNVGWEGFTMPCSCGAKGCRKVIRSYWNLDEALRKRYGRNVSSYLLRGRPR